MSIAFAGALKLRNGTDRDAFSLKMTAAALEFGYGLMFEPDQSADQWASEAVQKLGGGEAALFFEAISEPWDTNIDEVFTTEMWEPLDWSKVQFPTFLLKLWQLPEIEAALFVRYNSDMHDLQKEDSLPQPVSIYKAMEAAVSNYEGPARQWYLDKSSAEPVWRG